MNTKPTPQCQRCGAPLTADAPEGLCPRCLMALNLAAPTEIPGETGPHGTKAVKPPPPAPSEMAKHFPQLEILECLGRGGMGVVYKARQPRLDRLVALKIIAPEKEKDPQFAERFAREAKALARLNHPNIVTVYDFGEADGLYYLMMEFVDGVGLRRLIAERKLSPQEALAIVPKICEALQFAHDQGVVHRDIKPENVLLDKQGRVKIADFGIAKIVGDVGQTSLSAGSGDFPVASVAGADAGQESPAHWQAGKPAPPSLTADQVLGTPHYMAPEQVEHPQTVDHRADIYSLGVVFYEMLTGELPLGKFQPPSKKVQVDVRLDEVVLHALEKEPERRYQQASQVKTDVETIARTEGGGAKSEPERNRVAPPVKAGGAESVWQQVRGPAIGLVVTAVLNWVAIPLIFVVTAVVVNEGGFHHGFFVGVPLLVLVLGSIMLVAGLKMKRFEAYGLAITGAILAMLVAPGNLIGLPLGIWALVVLSRRQVREAFGKGLPAPRLEPGQPARGGGAWKVTAVIVAAVMILLAIPLAIPLGAFFLAIVMPNLSKARQRAQVVAADSARVVRVEEKLRQEIEKRLSEAGWRVEGISVSVTPDLKRAECRLGTARKDGSSPIPIDGAIHVKPQGRNLWLVEGDGEFQFLRFSVDTSAEMEQMPGPGGVSWAPVVDVDPNAQPVAMLAASFGPVREVTLNDIDDYRGSDLLDLDAGKTLDLDRGFEKWPHEQQDQWLKDNGVDVMLDHADRQWGLITPQGNPLKLVSVANTLWDGLGATQLELELNRRDPGVQTVSRRQITAYLLTTNAAAPLTFAFATANGARGLLQITGFAEEPNSAQLRFKLARDTAVSRPETGNSVFGPVIEKVVTGLIDLDTGTLVDWPLPEQAAEAAPVRYAWINNEDPQARPWMRERGIDAADANHGLCGVDLWFMLLKNNDWQRLTPDELREQLRHQSPPQSPGGLPLSDNRGTYAFQTREGSLGVLQVLGRTDGPRGLPSPGVTIRYKLVQVQ